MFGSPNTAWQLLQRAVNRGKAGAALPSAHIHASAREMGMDGVTAPTGVRVHSTAGAAPHRMRAAN